MLEALEAGTDGVVLHTQEPAQARLPCQPLPDTLDSLTSSDWPQSCAVRVQCSLGL